MFRKLVLLVLYILVPLGAAIATFVALHFVFMRPASPGANEPMVFEVAENETFSSVAKRLENDGFVRFEWAIKMLAQLRGQDTSIKAGEYELNRGMTPGQLLEIMATGKMLLRRVTVKEGASIWEIGALLENAGITTRIDFEKALADPTLQKELGVEGESFEGYLFPETYQFPRNTSAKKVLSTMREQLDKAWKPDWDGRLQILKMSKHQVLTLASIVEKESGATEEQPVIASVFHNRLSRGMRLQADPTVIYGITGYAGNITKEDLLTPTPYNTYVIQGLPPTPIANPGATAIQATLYPEGTDFLYFVADGQGRHVFSADLLAHNNAVNKYQRNRQPPATVP